ncbi:MAG: MgtC/SapB family protein [Halobacteriales archaeon]
MVDPVGDPLSLVAARLVVAVGIGAIVGLEREQSESDGLFAGSRTFPLFALYGALTQAFFPGMVPLALLAIAIPLTVAYVAKVWLERDIGLTTLAASLLTVLLGAMTMHSEAGAIVAIVVAGVVTVLLSAKGWIHDLADRIEERERIASIKFILVVMVVFPLLPDEELDLLLGLNPRFVWLMVVFVTGLSFVAYVAARVIGTTHGIALTGLLGGFVSSTATAVSMAQRAKDQPRLYRICAFATIAAAVVMFPRALVEVAVVNPALFPHVIAPLGVMTAVGTVTAAAVYYRSRRRREREPVVDLRNPFRLRPALVFGALFAVVIIVSEGANARIGDTGIYATAFLAGLADVDAITISLSALEADGEIATEVATAGIVLGSIANTLVKVALAWLLGTADHGRLVALGLGGAAGVGVVTLVLL